MRKRLPLKLLCSCLCLLAAASGLLAAEADYDRVDALFQKHCLDCHNAKDAEGQLILDSYELLMKGGESGAAVLPGKATESILVKSVEGSLEKDGKRKIMPPGAKRKKLDSDEIALLKTWIDAGAKGPSGPRKPVELITPKITLKTEPRKAVNSIAASHAIHQLAVARYSDVELFENDAKDIGKNHQSPAAKLAGHRGSVNTVLFSANGGQLFAAGGEPGLFGEVRQWDVSGRKLIRVFEGHQDAIYSIALSPDGKTLASGSYDQKIKLWDVESGKELSTLHGHNGAVFGLAFRPDGKILASASADRTIKLWNLQTGKRTDTLSQPLKEQYAVTFSLDGKRLFAAGADSRIRVWQVSETAVETTNPMLDAHFAHEGTILRLALSRDGQRMLSCSDDRTVKLWDAADVKQLRTIEKQPDWASAVTFLGDHRAVVGRMDGTWEIYEVGPTLKAEAK
jgi:hypothetical protein